MNDKRKESIIKKWLPFWDSMSVDQRRFYYEMFTMGDGWPQGASWRDDREYEYLRRLNHEFVQSNFSSEDISFLDTLPDEGHKDLVLECLIRSLPPEEREKVWETYTHALEYKERTSQIYTPQLITSVNGKLLDLVANRHDLLFKISDREFEELIAEIFKAEGYDVELTKRTRDNGYDVIAVYNSLIRQKLLIECKRKRNPQAKIPIGIVRQVLGSLEMSDVEAQKIVLVTTNHYTKDAKRAIARNHIWRIDLKDYDDVVQWLSKYK